MTELNANTSAGFDLMAALDQLADEFEGWAPSASPDELEDAERRIEEALEDLLEKVLEEIAARDSAAREAEDLQLIAELEAA